MEGTKSRAGRGTPARASVGRWGVRFGLCAVLVAVGVAGWLGVMPDPDALVARSSPDTTKVYDREGRLLFEVLDPLAGRRSRVPLGELPEHFVQAVVATEDAGFFRHPGIQPRAIVRSALQGLRQGAIVSGASTITQQLARLVLMDDAERRERSLRRKAREMVMAVRLTRRYDKNEILERYLNEVYFGQLAYGAEAAARTYFGKPAAQLDLAESALLAGLIQSPAAYNPLIDLRAARRRQAVVLRRMLEDGAITPREAELALEERLSLAPGGGPMNAPHFTTWVLGQLEARYGPHRVQRGGLHVVTSLDLELQRQAEAVIQRHLAALQRREPGKPEHHVTNAALVAIDPETGQVLAMVGSAGYHDAAIDGAVNVALSERQPGSAVKPLTYLTAFDVDRWGVRRAQSGDPPEAPVLPYTPATVLSDVPASFTTREGDPYRPVNYDRKWHGPISLRRALATSSNMVAVKVLDAVGLDALLDTCHALGIRTLADRDRYGLALTLGGGEVKLLELAAAYAGLAAGGHRVTPVAVLAVLDATTFREGLTDSAGWGAASGVTPEPVVSPQAAWLVTDILADDAARLPAFGEGGPLAMNRPAAAKTGTTTDFRDNWTVGYTPQLAVGVWVGNADGSPMSYISGITGAAPIWRETMEMAHRGLPVRAFARPAGLQQVEVCTGGGGLPGPTCRRRAREWFVSGTEPLHVDDSYVAVAVDASTGLGWDAGCAGPRVERVYRLLPADALEWGRRFGVEAPPEHTCSGALRVADHLTGARSAARPPAASPAEAAARGRAREALQFVRPAAGSTFAVSARLPREHQRIDVALVARDGRTAEVVLYLGDTRLATWDGPPYETSWHLEPGAHTLRAEGRDARGRWSASAAVEFVVLAGEPEQAQ